MASPQLENGFTRLANEIIEALARTNMNAYQWRVVMAVIRETYGFGRKEVWLSNKWLTEITGIAKSHVSRAVRELKQRNIVASSGNKIAFNKDYQGWRELPRQVTLPNQVSNDTSLGTKCYLVWVFR